MRVCQNELTHPRFFCGDKFASLFCTKCEALEVCDGEILVDALEVGANGEVLVPDVLLAHQTVFLEELVHATLCDVLDHGGVEICCLLC